MPVSVSMPGGCLCVSPCLVLPQCPAQFVIVHVSLALPFPPQSGQLLRVTDDELAPLPAPSNGPALAPPQELKQEVPQLHLPGAWGPRGLVRPIREQHCWGNSWVESGNR